MKRFMRMAVLVPMVFALSSVALQQESVALPSGDVAGVVVEAPIPVEGSAPVLCQSDDDEYVCMDAPGWMCAPSSHPDPEEARWDYCNWSCSSEDPFDCKCVLPPDGSD